MKATAPAGFRWCGHRREARFGFQRWVRDYNLLREQPSGLPLRAVLVPHSTPVLRLQRCLFLWVLVVWAVAGIVAGATAGAHGSAGAAFFIPVAQDFIRESQCHWGSTTVTTATSSSRTRPGRGSVTSRAPPTSANASSGTIPSEVNRGSQFTNWMELSALVYASTLPCPNNGGAPVRAASSTPAWKTMRGFLRAAEVFEPGPSVSPSGAVATHRVTVHDRQRNVTHEFIVPEDQYILHTAESQDITLPFACRHGCCTSCAVPIKSGQIRQPEALGISAELKEKVLLLS